MLAARGRARQGKGPYGILRMPRHEADGTFDIWSCHHCLGQSI